jgi:hypothetical protein
LVATDQNAVYALLRTRPDEQVLVIINLSGETIAGYQLEAGSSPLSGGRYPLEPLMGTLAANLRVNSDGGFSLSVDSPLAPFETLVLKLD